MDNSVTNFGGKGCLKSKTRGGGGKGPQIGDFSVMSSHLNPDTESWCQKNLGQWYYNETEIIGDNRSTLFSYYVTIHEF